MEKLFAQFRKVSIIAVIASALGSFLMFVIGAVKVFRAYESYLPGQSASGVAAMTGATRSMVAGITGNTYRMPNCSDVNPLM